MEILQEFFALLRINFQEIHAIRTRPQKVGKRFLKVFFTTESILGKVAPLSVNLVRCNTDNRSNKIHVLRFACRGDFLGIKKFFIPD